MTLKEVRHSDKYHTRMNSFIDVIHSYVVSIQKSPKEYHKPLKGGLDMALRIVTGSHASFVSEKILDCLSKEKIMVNPFDLIWEDRHKMGHITLNNRKHSVAVWEHTIPIKEFRESLIKNYDKDKVKETLFEYPGVAWITREEDTKLSKLGFRTKRPGGFLKCYNQAGIKLLHILDYEHRIKQNVK